MKGLLIGQPGQAPQIRDVKEPQAGEGETVRTVTAAPLTPITKLIAAGRHYAGGDVAGTVPGVDGVGIDVDGRRHYFLFPKAPFGSMAERVLVSAENLVTVPEDLTDTEAAAIATAGTASWMALTRRSPIDQGQTGLIAGATGAAGSMGVQVARHLGARRVVAVGRSRERLDDLAADDRIVLDSSADEKLRAIFDQGVDVALDFTSGEPAVRILRAATRKRGSRTREPRLRYVVLGTIAGSDVRVSGDMLRGTGLELLGCGLGSISKTDLISSTSELLAAAKGAAFKPSYVVAPLEKAEELWDSGIGIRYIFQPSSAAV